MGVGQRLVDVVEDHHNGNALLPVEPLHQTEDLHLIAHIQKGCWLVQKQQLGVLGQSHGQKGPLPLAAGEHSDGPLPQAGQIGEGQGTFHLRLILPVQSRFEDGAVGQAAVAHQPLHRQVLRRGVLLVDDGGLPGKVPQGDVPQFRPLQIDTPPVRGQVFGQKLQQGAFSAAVGPHEGGDGPPPDGQGQVTEHRGTVVVTKGQLLNS